MDGSYQKTMMSHQSGNSTDNEDDRRSGSYYDPVMILAEIDRLRSELRRFDQSLTLLSNHVCAQMSGSHVSGSPSPTAISDNRSTPVKTPSRREAQCASPFLERSMQNGKPHMRLCFDLRNYDPHEIEIRIEGNLLKVHARHQQDTQSGHMYREFTRQHTIPDGVLVDSIKSTLSDDGQLVVEAPYQTSGDVTTNSLTRSYNKQLSPTEIPVHRV